jgi:hypothetical protein
MSLFEILSANIFPEVCPPDQTSMLGLLRSTSKKFKTEIDNMSLEVHIEIKSFNIDDIIKNIKRISKNYTITKIKFSKNNTILMFINIDIIGKLCPFLTHLDLGSNNFISLKEFKTNLPKCNVIKSQLNMFSCDCKRVKETREYTFGTTYYYGWYNHNKWNYHNDAYQFTSKELRADREVVLAAVQLDNIQEKEVLANVQHKAYTKQAYKVRDHETKALNKRFHCTKKSQYNTNALNQRYIKKY